MSVGKVRTGILLILVGVFLLLNTLDVVSVGLWENLLVFWPIFLIAIGIEKIFSSSENMKPLAYLSPLLIVATFAYVVVAGPTGGSSWSDLDSDSSPDTMNWQATADPSTQHVSLKVDFGGGRLTIAGGASAGNLVDGRFQHRGRKPRITTEHEGSTLRVVLSQPSNRGRITIGSGHDRERWNVRVCDTVPLDLNVEAGGSLVRLNLADVLLQKLDLSSGAADVDLVLGDKSPKIECNVDCGAASVDMTIPAGAGLRLTREIALGSLSTGDIAL
ncbi:MAG: hypothetical protein HZB43_05200, partial [candidate division Zixibacteria bacterium]|nr:hypothetical protein [candidate division Zixibacteria bacterium]